MQIAQDLNKWASLVGPSKLVLGVFGILASGDSSLGVIVEDLEPLLTSGKSGHYHFQIGFWFLSSQKFHKLLKTENLSLWGPQSTQSCAQGLLVLFSPLSIVTTSPPLETQEELRRQSQWQGRILPWEQGLCRQSNLGPDPSSVSQLCDFDFIEPLWSVFPSASWRQ